MIEWTEQQRKLRDDFRQWHAPFSACNIEHDRRGCFPIDTWQAVMKSGILRLPFAEKWGGLNQSLLTTLYVLEDLGRGCRDGGLNFSISTQICSTGIPIQRFGSDDLQNRYLPRICAGSAITAHAISEPQGGSDAMNMQTTATNKGDHFVLDGRKSFVSLGPVADLVVVYARTAAQPPPFGITAFVVERDTPGFVIGPPIDKMGTRTSPFCELSLAGCKVPAGNVLGNLHSGFLVFDHVLKWEILCSFMITTGEMQHRLERCVDFARTREQFGQPIGFFQSIANKIVDMKIGVETAQKWIYDTAEKFAADANVTTDIAISKLVVSEANIASAMSAIQIFGGRGYLTEYGLEKDLRDAIGGTIYSGTSEIHRQRIAAMLGLAMKRSRPRPSAARAASHTYDSASPAPGRDRHSPPSSQSLLQSLLHHCRSAPTEPALIWRGQRVDYGTLAGMAERARAAIHKLALASDAVLCILAKKSPETIALMLGCMLEHRPFLLPSAELGPMTLDALLQQSGCRGVLTTEPDRTAAVLVDLAGGDIPTRSTEWAPGWESPDLAEISFLLTTSGSTGVPKVVPLSIGAVDRFSDWASATFGMSAGTTVLNYAPLNFDLCLLDIWSTLKAGGRVVLVDQDRAMDPRYLVKLLTSNDITIIQAVPILYQLLLEAIQDRVHSFGSVAHVIFTGYAMPAGILAQLPRLFPNARFYNIYGCTETNDSFIHEADPSQAVDPLPIGQPLPGVNARIRDSDGRAVEAAGEGELWVSTPFQTGGYLGQLADEKFVRCARPDGSGEQTWFRTGDLVRRHGDGTLTIIGRTDFRVKVRGVCVNLEEVEQAILEHDQVCEAAVVAVPDQLAGSRLWAMVRRDRTSTVNTLALRTHCAQRLPRVAIPSTIHLTESPLPRTATGKIDRPNVENILTNLFVENQDNEHS